MRHARLVPAAAGLLLYLASACMAAAQDLPRVRLVATGGTISNRTGGRLIGRRTDQPRSRRSPVRPT